MALQIVVARLFCTHTSKQMSGTSWHIEHSPEIALQDRLAHLLQPTPYALRGCGLNDRRFEFSDTTGLVWIVVGSLSLVNARQPGDWGAA